MLDQGTIILINILIYLINISVKLEFLTIYDGPASVPTSQGYKFNTFFSIHVQLAKQSSKPATPNIQSGEGSIFDTNDIT